MPFTVLTTGEISGLILHAMADLKAFAGVARAPFLLLPVTLVAVGRWGCLLEGSLSWTRTLLALIGLVALHMAVNIFNEWSDMRTGIDLATERTPFSGRKRHPACRRHEPRDGPRLRRGVQRSLVWRSGSGSSVG